MKSLSHEVDLLVVGGGVAGTVAAIAAARRGLKTVLVQDRPVLGGPSSSECSCNSNGAFINGASEYMNRNARECGVLEEMKLEAFYRRANGWEEHWSLVLREWAEREPNLTLLLNTLACDVTMDGRRITSVTARTLGSDTEHCITASAYLDCSGDSFLGSAAGAEFRMGREGRDEFGESLAPEKPDKKTNSMPTAVSRFIRVSIPSKTNKEKTAGIYRRGYPRRIIPEQERQRGRFQRKRRIRCTCPRRFRTCHRLQRSLPGGIRRHRRRS